MLTRNLNASLNTSTRKKNNSVGVPNQKRNTGNRTSKDNGYISDSSSNEGDTGMMDTDNFNVSGNSRKNKRIEKGDNNESQLNNNKRKRTGNTKKGTAIRNNTRDIEEEVRDDRRDKRDERKHNYYEREYQSSSDEGDYDDDNDTLSEDSSGRLTNKFEKINNENNDWKSKYIELKTEYDSKRKCLASCDIYSDGKNINKSTKSLLEILVKNKMFPKQKFVTQSELGNLSSKNSIGNKLMDEMNIPESDRIETWKNYAYVVKKHLDKIRSSKTTGMKNEFAKRGKNFVYI